MKLKKYGRIARAAKVIASLLHGDAEDIADAMQRMEAHRSAGTLHALNIAMVLQTQPDIHIWEGDYNDWHISFNPCFNGTQLSIEQLMLLQKTLSKKGGRKMKGEKAMTDYKLFKEDLLGSPGVHFWVKEVINIIENKDPVDVLHDLDILRELTEKRIK